MRFRCPVCEAVCDVPPATGAAAVRTRCDQCGLVFVPKGTPPADSTTSPAAPPGGQQPVPQPPSVNYSVPVPHGARPDLAGAISSERQFRPETSADAEAIPPAHRPAHIPPATPGAEVGNSASAPRPATAARTNESLGLPPPYLPFVPAPGPAPPRAEMAPAPPAAPVNIRGVGSLGPPPPYRPIVQAASVFGRGPAPDLEPWRLASLRRTLPDREPTRVPPGTEADEDEWALSREPEPGVESGQRPFEESRVETPGDFGPRDIPLTWPPQIQPPRRFPGSAHGLPRGVRGVRAGIATRLVRPLLWTAGIGVAVLGLGVVLHSGRQQVMRAFPIAGRIYDAFGVTGTPFSATRDQNADIPGVSCAEGPGAGPGVPPADQPSGCGDTISGPKTK